MEKALWEHLEAYFQRLQTDYINIYYQHSVNKLIPVETAVDVVLADEEFFHIYIRIISFTYLSQYGSVRGTSKTHARGHSPHRFVLP